MIRYLPHLPDIAKANFILFWRVFGWPLAVPGQLQDEPVGVIRTITKDKFSDNFQR
jgi:hypothetical protein